MNKKEIFEFIKENPNLTYEEIKMQAQNAGADLNDINMTWNEIALFKEKRRRRLKMFTIILIVLVLVIPFGIFGWHFYNETFTKTDLIEKITEDPIRDSKYQADRPSPPEITPEIQTCLNDEEEKGGYEAGIVVLDIVIGADNDKVNKLFSDLGLKERLNIDINKYEGAWFWKQSWGSDGTLQSRTRTSKEREEFNKQIEKEEFVKWSDGRAYHKDSRGAILVRLNGEMTMDELTALGEKFGLELLDTLSTKALEYTFSLKVKDGDELIWLCHFKTMDSDLISYVSVTRFGVTFWGD